ncbi:hypothetical protein A5676_18330 [Mycobacterium malmoense]|uniref:hypothetical protein n=1 Tax=Mycobacterium malmoense TaxID=1780 RepID=UPI00080B9968|nr:hypothetical protein [Mycobacterium malmoense]OCB37263.1 hypothetical protein A5676_18330 [Mycobacterium malmoense]
MPSEYLLLGYTLDDFERATRFTWKALRAMTAEQVRSAVDGVLAADNKLVNGLIMRRLFDNTHHTNEWSHTCSFAVTPLAGEHYRDVSRWLGHSKISTTLDIYAGVLPTEDTAKAAPLARPVAAPRTQTDNVVPLEPKAN